MRNLNDVRYKILDLPLNNHTDDVSGHGLTTSITGTETYIDGPFGRTASDFANTRINTNGAFNNNNFTIAFWSKPDDVTTAQYISDADSGTKLSVILGYQNGYFNIYNNSDYITGTATDTQIPAIINQWQHIIFTSNGTRTQGYKNGELIFDIIGDFTNTGLSQYDFGSKTTGSVPYDGKLFGVKIYNINVTGDEVKKLYQDSQRVQKQTKVSLPKPQREPYQNGNLVGAWGFNNGLGFKDSSGQGNDGTNTGTILTKDGGFDFDGVDSTIEIGDVSLPPSKTYALWFKTNIDQNEPHLFEDNGDDGVTALRLKNGGQLQAITFDGFFKTATTSSTYIDGGWHHVVMTLEEDADMIIYVDGLNVNSVSIGTPEIQYILYIGSTQGIGRFFNGTIDEVQIFNRSLSADEIKQIYNQGVPSDNENLALHLENDIEDLSVCKNTITVTGNPVIGDGMVFDGTDDILTTGVDLENSTWTIRFWYKDSSATNAYRRWLTSDTGAFTTNTVCLREYSSDNKLQLVNGSTTGLSEANIKSTDGGYHCYVIVSDGSGTNLYKDGNTTPIITTAGVAANPDAQLYIGGNYNDTSEYATGTMKGFKVYKGEAKSADWVKQDYLRTRNKY